MPHQGKIVLFDIDHTLSDASVRDHMLEKCRQTDEWEEYHSACIFDKPCCDVVALLNAFRHSDHPVFGITAQPAQYRKIRSLWLKENRIALDELLMHECDFWEPSAELKIELCLKRFGKDFARHILMIIDDHPEVIKAFQASGVTGLQCFGRKY